MVSEKGKGKLIKNKVIWNNEVTKWLKKRQEKLGKLDYLILIIWALVSFLWFYTMNLG